MANVNEVREKERRVREYLAANGLDAVLLSRTSAFAWFTCGGDNHVANGPDLGVGSALVTAQGKFILSDNIEAARLAEEEVQGQGFTPLVHPWQDAAARAKLVADAVAGGRCASDDATPGTQPLAGTFDELRYSLTPQEIDRYRDLGADCGEIVAEVTAAITPGETEAAIAGRLSAACCGRRITPFVTLVAADDRIAKYRHPIHTGKRVKQCAMVVLCGQRHGLICSVTRLVHFGKPTQDLRRRHYASTVVDAVLIAYTKVGAVVGDVLKAGLRAYAANGFAEEWKLHHQGGPTGYAARDYKATPEETRTVQLNQAFAWNPSITGSKSEDTMLALKNGPLVISMAGNWPTVTHKVGGMVIQRPDLLIK